jgi:hypothetical protein
MTVTIFGTAFLVMVLLYVAITFFFNRLIVNNLRDMLALFWGNLSDDKGRELLERTRTMDEIGELNTAAEIMAGHLQEVQADLRDHVENLEEKVANRTRALQEMARLLQDKELLQTVFDGITDLVVLAGQAVAGADGQPGLCGSVTSCPKASCSAWKSRTWRSPLSRAVQRLCPDFDGFSLQESGIPMRSLWAPPVSRSIFSRWPGRGRGWSATPRMSPARK